MVKRMEEQEVLKIIRETLDLIPVVVVIEIGEGEIRIKIITMMILTQMLKKM